MNAEIVDQLCIAFALVLILEGVFPSVAPKRWKQTFAQMIQLSDSQLRTMGLVSMFIGLGLLFWLN